MRDAGLQCYIWGQCQVIWSSIMTNNSMSDTFNPDKTIGMQLFLFSKGIFPRLQTRGRCRGLPCFRQGSRWEQLVVLGASSIPLPSVWELHRNRTPKWLNLPRLCQRRDCVSIARLHLYQCQWYQNSRSFQLETYFQGLQSWVSF